jgi:signal transduction histidine kinase
MASIASMESLYQVDLAAKENKILLNENKLRNDQAIFLLILAVVLIAFISFILYKYSQNKSLNKELKELNATKDKFFSIVAHDLKSPFNNLLGYSELLVEDYESMTDVERKNSVSDLHASSKKLVELVDNLLQWARANIGSFQYKPELINLSEFANNLAGVFDQLLSQKELVLNRKIDTSLNIYIDEDYLNLVMRNLLNNAIKFSHPKSEINFIVEEKDTRIEIMLEDHGVGIESSKLDKLFELGHNVSTTGTLNEKGAGLGLILAHDLVIKWGGEISVTSSLGKGSAFKVTIPKTKATS